MNSTLAISLVSGITTILALVLGYLLNKRREREADWRKVKLEHYKEYVAALSGLADHRSGDAAQTRYSDAFNSMMIIAPPAVIRALNAFQDETSVGNKNKSLDNRRRLEESLLLEIRKDVHPKAADGKGISLYMIDVVPVKASLS